MQAVGHLDEYHTNVVVHRQQQLAEVLSLRRCTVAEDSSRNFRQSVDNLRYLLAKLRFDVLYRLVGVLYHIMKQGRADGSGAKTYLVTHDSSHGNGVKNVRLA